MNNERKWEKIIMYRMRVQHSIYYLDLVDTEGGRKIGRASCRERV